MMDHLVKLPFAEEEISVWRERKGEQEGKKSFLEYPQAREPFRHVTSLFPQDPRELGFTALQICQGVWGEKMQGCANSKAKQLETVTMGQTSVGASWRAEGSTAA